MKIIERLSFICWVCVLLSALPSFSFEKSTPILIFSSEPTPTPTPTLNIQFTSTPTITPASTLDQHITTPIAAGKVERRPFDNDSNSDSDDTQGEANSDTESSTSQDNQMDESQNLIPAPVNYVPVIYVPDPTISTSIEDMSNFNQKNNVANDENRGIKNDRSSDSQPEQKVQTVIAQNPLLPTSPKSTMEFEVNNQVFDEQKIEEPEWKDEIIKLFKGLEDDSEYPQGIAPTALPTPVNKSSIISDAQHQSIVPKSKLVEIKKNTDIILPPISPTPSYKQIALGEKKPPNPNQYSQTGKLNNQTDQQSITNSANSISPKEHAGIIVFNKIALLIFMAGLILFSRVVYRLLNAWHY